MENKSHYALLSCPLFSRELVELQYVLLKSLQDFSLIMGTEYKKTGNDEKGCTGDDQIFTLNSG